MPITELATLLILPPFSVTSPVLTSFLSDVARLQSSWSGYPLYFFLDTQPSASDSDKGGEQPGVLYLISGWESVKAHEDWIASPENQGLLKRAEETGCIGVRDLVHLGIDLAGEEAREALEGSGCGLLMEGGKEQPEEGPEEFEEKKIKENKVWYAEGKDVEGKKEGVWKVVLVKSGGEEGLDSEAEKEGKKGWRVMKRVRV